MIIDKIRYILNGRRLVGTATGAFAVGGVPTFQENVVFRQYEQMQGFNENAHSKGIDSPLGPARAGTDGDGGNCNIFKCTFKIFNRLL